jgi:hypothetical protein
MTSYYDKATNTTYYDNQMVLNITEYDLDNEKDMNVYIVYDNDDQTMYVYGSRGNKKFVRFTKVFDNTSDLYDFISLSMGFSEKHTLSIGVNYIEGLTNFDEYDEIHAKVNRVNEIVAYDNIMLTKKQFLKYIHAFF